MNLQEKIDKGYKRMAIVSTIWAFISIIPYLILENFPLIQNDQSNQVFSFMVWFGLVLIGIFKSGSIVNKIWTHTDRSKRKRKIRKIIGISF